MAHMDTNFSRPENQHGEGSYRSVRSLQGKRLDCITSRTIQVRNLSYLEPPVPSYW